MSTAILQKHRPGNGHSKTVLLPLRNGEHLSREEFAAFIRNLSAK